MQSLNTDISELLTINQSSGDISKMGAANFDREATENINLTIIAYDNGSPRLTGMAQQLIIIQVCLIILVY